MAEIVLKTVIQAPIETVFDLARSVDLHLQSTYQTEERVVAGRSFGYLELGDEVTWEAKHFGIRQQLSVRIVAFNQPHSFTDVMLKGAFKYMEHKHHFEKTLDGNTQMIDEFSFSSPFGIVGSLFDLLFLKAYMTRFLKKRNRILKLKAEFEMEDFEKQKNSDQKEE